MMMPGFLFIYKNNKYHRVHVSEIQYISASGSYLHIVTPTEQFSLALNLSQFLRQNQIPSLVRIHRSFIVNLDCIDEFDHQYVYIERHQIPIGASYRVKFMERIVIC
jgi:two-component system, response regulator PdtaR